MLAIIPARGGSKGLPGKNILLLNGKPLIAYTIEAALNAKQIDKVIVSTDCKQIAETAFKFGANVPFLRPDYLSTDSALAVDNYIYTVDRLHRESKMKINEFVVLHPTTPLRTNFDIDNAIKLFEDKKADSVISYTKETHPISWHKRINEDLSFENIFNENIANRQDYRVTYYPNGAVYVFKVDIIKSKEYYSEKSYAYIMPSIRSVDIDTIEDLQYAEYLIKKRDN